MDTDTKISQEVAEIDRLMNEMKEAKERSAAALQSLRDSQKRENNKAVATLNENRRHQGGDKMQELEENLHKETERLEQVMKSLDGFKSPAGNVQKKST